MRSAAVTAVSVLVFALAACDGDGEVFAPSETASAVTNPGGDASPTPPVSEAPSTPLSADDYDPGRFDETSTAIDNQWFPMLPGTQFLYKGSTQEGKDRVHHRVVFTVTDLTKVIDGVRTIVIWDQDFTEGELVEKELALFAQDTDGNIWHFGQYPEEYEDGKFDKAPAWVAGFEGARTGLTMKADPQLGTPDYSQGFAPPPINWIDRARVYETGQQTCVPFGCFEDVLVTEEFEEDKPDAFQLKFYAPGVGNVRVGWRGAGEKERERLVLFDVVQLGPEELAEVREEALALEERAYKISKDVWGQTPLAQPLGEAGS